MPKILSERWGIQDFFKLALLGLLLGYAYYPTFAWMAERWFARDSYYGHGILIPMVSIYWIFKKRKELTASEAPNAAGVGVLILGAVLQVLASAFRVYFFSAFSLILILLGLVITLFGGRGFKAIGFPIFFLLLMVPLPLLLISQATLKMKLNQRPTWLSR